MTSVEDLEKMLVGSKVLENLFGVSSATVRRLAEQGIVERDSKGKYLFFESLKSYITALKASASSRAISIEGEDLDYDTVRTRTEYTKGKILELKLHLMEGKVHKAEDVESQVTDMLIRMKSHLEALGSNIARQAEGKSRIEIQRIVDNEVRKALAELSEYKPSDYYSDEHIDVTNDLEALGIGESKEG